MTADIELETVKRQLFRAEQEVIKLKDTPAFNSEEVDNMRRMAERGLQRAQLEKNSAYVDMFQHILGCYKRVYNK